VADTLLSSHPELHLRCWQTACQNAAASARSDREQALQDEATRPRKRKRKLSSQLDGYIEAAAAAALTREQAAAGPAPAASAAGGGTVAIDGAALDLSHASGPRHGTSLDALEPALRRAMIAAMHVALVGLGPATEAVMKTASAAVMRPQDGDKERTQWNDKVAKFYDDIQRAKAHGALPGQYVGEFQAVYQRYQQELNVRGAADFADLLLRMQELLARDGSVLARLQARYRYLLVDEAQDMCRVQLSLTRMLAGEGRRVTAVGDDDQSIFNFRGSEAWMLQAFSNM
jgi:hypothetical protein